MYVNRTAIRWTTLPKDIVAGQTIRTGQMNVMCSKQRKIDVDQSLTAEKHTVLPVSRLRHKELRQQPDSEEALWHCGSRTTHLASETRSHKERTDLKHSSELERILQDTLRVTGINLVKALAIGLKNVNNIRHTFNTE